MVIACTRALWNTAISAFPLRGAHALIWTVASTIILAASNYLVNTLPAGLLPSPARYDSIVIVSYSRAKRKVRILHSNSEQARIQIQFFLWIRTISEEFDYTDAIDVGIASYIPNSFPSKSFVRKSKGVIKSKLIKDTRLRVSWRPAKPLPECVSIIVGLATRVHISRIVVGVIEQEVFIFPFRVGTNGASVTAL